MDRRLRFRSVFFRVCAVAYWFLFLMKLLGTQTPPRIVVNANLVSQLISRVTGHLCASELCSRRKSDIIGDYMREVVIQQVSLGANGGLRLRPCPIGPSGYKYIWRAAMSVRWDEHDAELYVAYVGGVPDITLVEDFRLIVSAVASEHGDRLVLSPSTVFVGVPSEVVALLRGMAT